MATSVLAAAGRASPRVATGMAAPLLANRTTSAATLLVPGEATFDASLSTAADESDIPIVDSRRKGRVCAACSRKDVDSISPNPDAWNPVQSQRQQALQLQLNAAQAEVQQLRSALRASAGALHQTSALLPPGYRKDVDMERGLVSDLRRQLQQRSDEVLRLKRQSLDHEHGAGCQRLAVHAAVKRWIVRDELGLAREIWRAWCSMRQARLTSRQIQREAFECRNRMGPKITKIMNRLVLFRSDADMRLMVALWRSALKAARWDAKREAYRREKVGMTLLRWKGDMQRTTIGVCFSAWRLRNLQRQQEQREKQLQAEHERVAKDLQRQAIAKAASAFIMQGTSGPDPTALRVMVGSWRQCMLQGRVDKAREIERETARASEKRLKEQAQRRALLLMVQSAHPVLAALVQAWVDAIRQRRQSEAKAERHVRSRVFSTWQRLAACDHRARELRQLRTALEEKEKTHAAELRKHQKMRQAVSGLAFDNPMSWMQVAWSCWFEFHHEARRAKEHEADQQKWQSQYEERQKGLVGRGRIRAVLLAAKQTSGSLLRVAWSSWIESFEDAKRDAELGGQQRVFEDDTQKREAKVLEAEQKLRDTTGKQQMRNAMFLRSLNESDELHLWYAWSAWQRCWQDARSHEINELRQKLDELKTSKPTRGAEKSLRLLTDNSELLLCYAWWAWRECLQEAQNLEVSELRQKLEQLRIKPLIDASEHPASSPDDIAPTKPGRCHRLCRGLRSLMCPCTTATVTPVTPVPLTRTIHTPPPPPPPPPTRATKPPAPALLELPTPHAPMKPNPTWVVKAKMPAINQLQQINCPQGHRLVQATPRSSWVCDGCQKSIRSLRMQQLSCHQCNYDLCPRCAAKRAPTGTIETPRSPGSLSPPGIPPLPPVAQHAGEPSSQAELHVPEAAGITASHYCAMDWFVSVVNFVIQLVSLGENLFTTYYFDEDNFTPIYLALVFCFEPIIESCIKQLLNCTECDWDNFIFDLLSEGLQCFLYIYFCSYSDEAKFWLPIMMAVQVFLMIVLKMKEKCCDAEEQLTKEQKVATSIMRCLTCCQGNCFTLFTSFAPLFFLLYQEDAPYMQKTFEMILTGSYWLADISLQSQMQAMEEAAKGDSSGVLNIATGASWTVKITSLGSVAFLIYTYVLAWMYWFSPEIDKTFDKVYTMITMVSSCSAVCWLPAFIFNLLCGGGRMPGGEGMPADVFGNPSACRVGDCEEA